MSAAPASLALAILLLVAGCGGSFSTTFEIGQASAETKLAVTAWNGKVRLRNSTSGRVEVTVRGEAPLPLDRVVAFTIEDGSGIRIAEAAKDADLELEIAAPAGISLSCACADADVEVSGAWNQLRVTTTGAIDARVDAHGGSLKSHRGDVAFVALGAGPIGELRAESTSGGVSVMLPAAWKGQLKFQTQTGKLDVPTRKGLETIWDENRKGVVGRLGGPREEGAPFATVWGVSGTGDVSFRMGE